MGEELEEIGISTWLQNKCSEMWDIRNTKSQELHDFAGESEGRLDRMNAYVRDNWNRQDLIDYHMGNIFVSSNGSLKWAVEHGMNKIKALKYLLDLDEPRTLETAQGDINNIKDILYADGKDEVYLALIRQDFNFWDNKDDDELGEI